MDLDQANSDVQALKRDAQRIEQLAKDAAVKAASLERVRADLTAELQQAAARRDALQAQTKQQRSRPSHGDA